MNIVKTPREAGGEADIITVCDTAWCETNVAKFCSTGTRLHDFHVKKGTDTFYCLFKLQDLLVLRLKDLLGLLFHHRTLFSLLLPVSVRCSLVPGHPPAALLLQLVLSLFKPTRALPSSDRSSSYWTCRSFILRFSPHPVGFSSFSPPHLHHLMLSIIFMSRPPSHVSI